MARQRERILLSWSGGKDSAMTLYEIRKAKVYEVVGLVTAISGERSRVNMHGVCRDLVEAQARAIDLPLSFVPMPKDCSNSIYTEKLHQALTSYKNDGISKVAFGDLFLDDIRDFREECLEAMDMEAVFPLWHRDTKELSYSFINHKFKAVITCVNQAVLDESFVGRPYDRALLADLPLSVDPCGENGEFHTFVYDGPLFLEALPIKVGEHYDDSGLRFCEIETRSSAKLARSGAS